MTACESGGRLLAGADTSASESLRSWNARLMPLDDGSSWGSLVFDWDELEGGFGDEKEAESRACGTRSCARFCNNKMSRNTINGNGRGGTSGSCCDSKDAGNAGKTACKWLWCSGDGVDCDDGSSA